MVADVLSPERCAACDEPVRRRTVFCFTCAQTLESHDEPGGELAPFRYGGALARAIARFKYEGRPDLARPLASLLLRAAPLVKDADIEVVVPVPLHSMRLAERGYNQAALLAAPLARVLGAAHAPRAMARVVDTRRQVSLDRSLRMQNVRDAFVVRTPERLRGRRVLLVDDVRTTGSTIQACERAARAAAPASVVALTLAFAADL